MTIFSKQAKSGAKEVRLLNQKGGKSRSRRSAKKMGLKNTKRLFRIPDPMKKEITAVVLFFIFLFLVVSLFSYSANDPSIHNATDDGLIHNWFGLVGAYFSGLLIGLFGVGAFWIPLVLLIIVYHVYSGHQPRDIATTILGGFILILTTGALFAVWKNHYAFFDTRITSGGVIGIPLKTVLADYANVTGAVIILIIVWNIGFILMTGISAMTFVQECLGKAKSLGGRIKTLILIRRERRRQAGKRIVINNSAPEKQEEKKEPSAHKPFFNPLMIRKPAPKAPPSRDLEIDPPSFGIKSGGTFEKPSFEFLDEPDPRPAWTDKLNLENQSRILERKLEDFGVRGDVVEVTPGPVITTYEYRPAPGIKINKVVNLTDDLALALKAISIRIVAPIPGKSVIGIEIPNEIREVVKFKEVVSTDVFAKSRSRLTLCLGKDIVGNPVAADLDKMPHLLIAGATGTGKSVGLNSMITSFLYKSSPDEIKLIMIDPKRIELSIYDGIPHLITPVVTDVKKATNALFWAVREMERRYEMLSEMRVRNITQYNRKARKEMEESGEEREIFPYIVVIIDELADLMIVAPREVEIALTRLAQMARASGIHLILATQRPSVNVLTGIIKANFPTRLSYQVSSKIDSRTILDANGAESLLGNGDMLFQPPGTARLQRIHGPYISEEEIYRITDFLKRQKPPEYDGSVISLPEKEGDAVEEEEYDEHYDDAVAFVTKAGKASISMIQRRLRIGYNRAARIVEVMEKEGVIGPADGVKPREVLVKGYDE